MKRPSLLAEPESQNEPKRTKHSSLVLANFRDVIDALDNLDFTSDQLVHLSKKIDGLYSLKVNPISQHFPTDLWQKILHIAKIPKLPLNDLLALRTVSQSWNQVIRSFTRINTRRKTAMNCPKLFTIFPSLRSLRLGPACIPKNMSLLTGLTTLKLDDQTPDPTFKRFSANLAEFSRLTNLTKLMLRSTTVASLRSLTFLSCLHLLAPLQISQTELDQLPHLTRLITNDASLFLQPREFGVLRETNRHYEGGWDGTVFHGQGTLIELDRRYEGQWRDGQEHGYGVAYLWDEHAYSGKPWKVDKTGPQMIAKYEGLWEDGRECGHGVCWWTVDGTRYEGQWEGGQQNGEGVQYDPDGGRFEGHWRDGGREGHGIYYYSDGSHHEGQWNNDLRTGQGIHYYPSGARFEGEWVKGVCTKKGTFYDPTGKATVINGFWPEQVEEWPAWK